MKMIIDCDPGVDDAMAVFYATGAPDIELVGLTTIFGNVHQQQAARNARRLVERANAGHIPVAGGAGKPRDLPPFPPSHNVHGDEGFGDLPAEDPAEPPVTEEAADFLIRMAREHKGALTVAAIGPLTNIAAAIEKDPEFTKNLAQLTIMGGAVFVPGNITPYAEANIYHDPHAADIVLGAGGNIVLVGLDVTMQLQLNQDDFDGLATQSPVTGGFLAGMTPFYINFYREVSGQEGCALHDPTAVIAATHPKYFKMVEMPVGVITEGEKIGTTRAARDDRPDILVAKDVEVDKVIALYMKKLCPEPVMFGIHMYTLRWHFR